MPHRFALFIFLVASSAFACLHFDKRFDGKIDEGTQFAFLFHDGKSAHLVIKTDVKAKDGNLPPSLSWVLPFPALPTHYEEASSSLLPELASALSDQKSKGWGVQRGAIRVHEVKDVGNYKITPIEITADAAAQPFNEWLVRNRYNPMPVELQKAYLKKGAVFLAITLKLEGKEAKIKPLHVTYPAADLSVPIKFTHDARTFDAVLFVLTNKPIEKAPEYFTITGHVAFDPRITPETAKLVGERKGQLTRLEARGLNGPGKKLRELASDPRFTP